MAKKNDRFVQQRPDGRWENKRVNTNRATSVHDTQRGAVDAARQNLVNQGGGELNIKNTGGKVRQKNTIAPGNDPHPPVDKT